MRLPIRFVVPSLLAAACAQDVGDVDRTQPNRIKKSVFDGEWYLLKTTIDVPYTGGFTFVGETGEPELERVKFEIEEKYLIAYRSYDFIENTQQPNVLPDATFRGAPIAAYAIESHLDVIREYNAQTGEETNVIIENTDDRPWYEREYIRVDWSKNLALSFRFLDEHVAQVPINYYVQERTDSDRLLIGVKEGEGWKDTQDWNEIAKLDGADYIDMVDVLFAEPTLYGEEDDYGHLITYPACWFFASEDCQPSRIKIRSAFLKIDPNEKYEALAYPDNAVARDGNGKAIKDSLGNTVRIPWFDKFGYMRIEREHYDREREITESGRTYLISRFGIWKDAPDCKVGDSYESCTVRPIVYYLSPGFPEYLRDEAQHLADQWNEVLKDVVNNLKYGGARQLSEVEDVFILRDNDFGAGGGPRGQRIGDLRYSFLYYIPEPQAVGPLGYGPHAADPLTGRVIAGYAYVYGAGLESWATQGADLVALINGTIPAEEFIDGEDVREAVARIRGDYASRAGSGQRTARLEKAREFARGKHVKKARERQHAIGKKRMRLDRGMIHAKLDAIRDTPLEDRLLNDEVVRAFVPGARRAGAGDLIASLTPAERARISPARWGTTGTRRELDRKRRLKLHKSTLKLAKEYNPAVIGLAKSLTGKTRDEIRRTIMERVFAATAEHEVGHTLGLRHNFAGSFDALNYRPEYWMLRGNSPQPFEDETQAQIDGRMREQQYASIMDYGASFNSDIHGIGLYDKAAIRFGYGQLVEVFEEGAEPDEPLTTYYDLSTALWNYRHYTSLPRLFGGDAMRIYRRKQVPYKQVVEQMTGQSQSNLVEVPYRFCSDEYDGAQASCATYDSGPDAFEIVRNVTNEYEQNYILLNFARDTAVSPDGHLDAMYYYYFMFPQMQYQHWYFDGWDLYSEWEYLREEARDLGIEDKIWDESIDGGLSGALAAKEGLGFLARVIQTPEPGAYSPDALGLYTIDTYDTTLPLCPPGENRPDCSPLNVQLGTGKYALSEYDVASGYTFYDRIKVIGSFYDKLAALQTITSPETNFLGVDEAANMTQYAISLFDTFPDEVTRIVGGTAIEGYGAFSGLDDNQQFRFRDPFAPKDTYAGMSVVDPATSFTIELYAAWLGMAFLQSSFDNTFNDRMKIWIEGNGEAQTPAPGVPESRIARFTHPRTGRTFIAVQDADPEAYSPAFQIVNRARQVLDDSEIDDETKRYEIENLVSIMDTIRGNQELYGDLWF